MKRWFKLIASVVLATLAADIARAQNPDDVYWDNSIRPIGPRICGTVNAIVEAVTAQL